MKSKFFFRGKVNDMIFMLSQKVILILDFHYRLQ
jgi:hypothetical protein